jgi:hypothetical protein
MRIGTTDDPLHRAAFLRRDAIVALLLALFLSLCWTINDWPQVGQLNLPDHDDMMRLAQVRDWLAGQAFNDWTQYRLAPPEGASMHWSRINDVGIAAIIVAARPFLGAHGAELLAVILYPALLFAAYLFLSGRIARRLGGSSAALVAIVVAALAYPANSLFLPGRIDHHALQIVLILGAILALMRPPAIANGAVAGVCIALSLGIGLETAPYVAAVIAVLCGQWIWRGDAERARLIAAGAATGGVTLLLLLFARPTYWTAQWCDAFTPASSSATLAAAGAWIALGLASPRLPDWRARLALAGTAGAAVLTFAFLRYPVCLTGPYGPMDPFVRSAFMDNVVEARGLFQHRLLSIGLPSGGLIAAALLVAGWFLATHPLRRRAALPLVAVLAISAVVTLFQVRGAYLGSAVAAPLLAQLILAARDVPRWRGLAVAGAWLASAGMVYLIVPERIDRMLAPQVRASFQLSRSCNAGDVWRQLDRYPPGTVMAPMDRAAYIIGGTHHGSVAAGYHRNNRGNRAMYDFFLASPERARRIGAQWGTRYVAICPRDFAELDLAAAYPDSLATRLIRGETPAWLEPLPLRDTGLQFYRVR